MKKLSVLLVAAAVALSASAGVNNRIVNNPTTKVSVKEMKAKAGERQTMNFKRGATQNFTGTQLKAMDWQVRTTNHALRDGANLLWDFEDEAQLNDWMVLDNDGDGFGWTYFNMTGVETGRMTPYSGEGLMASASYDNEMQVALTPDNWLISPVVTLNKTFSFYAAGQDASYAAEVFGVYVCVGDPTNINDFVQVGSDRTATGNYTKYTYDLSAYEGMQGCVAIRHYNVTDMFWLNIDDVAINGDELEPEPVVPDVIYDIPETCELYTFYRNSAYIASGFFGISNGTTDGKVNVAIDAENGECYVQNPLWYTDTYNTWVKGTCEVTEDGILLTIPVGQYLMYSEAYGYGIQLFWGSTYVYQDGYDEETGEPLYYLGTEVDERTTEIQYLLTENGLFLIGSEGNMNAEFPENFNSTGLMAIYSDDLSWISNEFANVDEEGNALPFGYMVNLVPAVPANPTADEWYDCGDESGFSKFYFTLPTFDVDGNMLDPEYISYSIFVDNGNGPELFTFPAVDYTYDLYEDITEVTYDLYSSAVDFRDYFCYFYRTNEPGYEPLFTDDIGIQVYYTVNGEKNASDIVWLYGVHSSVDELVSGKTVANVRYFNVAGQEMAQPNGLTIQVTTYTDGTTSAAKVVK